MAYTIKFNNVSRDRAYSLRLKFLTALEKACKGKFTFVTLPASVEPLSATPGEGRNKENKTPGYALKLERIRLVNPTAYCGQHPGECQIRFDGSLPKKPVNRFLDWNEWVSFHGIVNRVLSRLKADADVWTRPPELMDHGQSFFIRRGLKPRLRWDWEPRYRPGSDRYDTIWNHGSPDQF